MDKTTQELDHDGEGSKERSALEDDPQLMDDDYRINPELKRFFNYYWNQIRKSESAKKSFGKRDEIYNDVMREIDKINLNYKKLRGV